MSIITTRRHPRRSTFVARFLVIVLMIALFQVFILTEYTNTTQNTVQEKTPFMIDHSNSSYSLPRNNSSGGTQLPASSIEGAVAKEPPPPPPPDMRRSEERPFMETTSRTFADSVLRMEEMYKPTKDCSDWGGMGFLDSLLSSEKFLLKRDEGGGGVENNNKGNRSQIIHYGNEKMDIFLATDVVLNIKHPENIRAVPMPGDLFTYSLEVNQDFVDSYDPSSILVREEDLGKSSLLSLTKNIRPKTDGIQPGDCTEYIEHPIFLIDDNIDSNNWWFFLVGLFKHYIVMTVAQEHVMGDYHKHLRVMHTTHNEGNYKKPFMDAFDILFADIHGSGMNSRQMWLEPPHQSTHDKTSGVVSKRYCLRKLLWSPHGYAGGGSILINRQHEHSQCFSPLVYSYAAYLKAALHIPTLPRPEKPVIVWVGRDQSLEANPTSWQQRRIINNQDEVITYLDGKCQERGIELVVADFYGPKNKVALLEQANFVSRANIMIGVHGAGLNLFHFMPFNSVVVEIHMETSAQQNSGNFVNHIREGKHIPVEAVMNFGSGLDLDFAWKTLEGAIEAWEKLASS